MKQAGRGTIVNIASGAALRPLEQRTAYCAAKAGLVMFGKTLAVDLAADHIRVNAICPGIIDTPLFRSSWEGAADPEGELARILDRYVIRRPGEPESAGRAGLTATSRRSSPARRSRWMGKDVPLPTSPSPWPLTHPLPRGRVAASAPHPGEGGNTPRQGRGE
jgi:NAD(P)-dependent dehydrogenase (short-subunit alcohol dehydrogenase family)